MIFNHLPPLFFDMTFFSLALVVSFLLTQGAYRFALRKNVLDIPNDRSSHSTPTPRGGGLGIVLTFLPALLLLRYFGTLSTAMLAALFGGGTLIALVGWMDDLKPIPARWRFMIHVIAAGWAIYWIGGVTELTLGPYSMQLGIGGIILTFLGILWMINLYNFMDGIDGLAGGEALTTGLSGGTLFWLGGSDSSSFLPLLLAACCGGFLLLNWPPAKIFMGDIGSGFIGYCLAIIWIHGAKADPIAFWVWAVLLSVFIGDATFTLISRVIKREPWYQAHRTHAYQRLIQMGWSHLSVTGLILLFNLFLLFPFTWYIMDHRYQAFMGTIFLYGLLFFAWFFIYRKYASFKKRKTD
jgi:Fuc2NAc and GlcNAc transferase